MMQIAGPTNDKERSPIAFDVIAIIRLNMHSTDGYDCRIVGELHLQSSEMCI